MPKEAANSRKGGSAAAKAARNPQPSFSTRSRASAKGTSTRPMVQEAKKADSRDLSRNTVRRLTGAFIRNFRS